MSPLYMYGIVDQPAMPLSAGAGLEEAAPFIVCHRQLGAVVSRLAAARVEPSESNAWQHEAVVERLMAERAVLPMRFGTLVPDEAGVQSALEQTYDAFVATLDQVRGRLELSLRVLWDEDGPEAPPAPQAEMNASPEQRLGETGRAYLMARLAEERRLKARRERAEGLAGLLHNHLARMAAANVQQVLATPRMLLTAAYLIERNQLSAFQSAVQTLSETYTTLRFLCTGPWPAYSFVGACSPAAGGEDRNDGCI